MKINLLSHNNTVLDFIDGIYWLYLLETYHNKPFLIILSVEDLTVKDFSTIKTLVGCSSCTIVDVKDKVSFNNSISFKMYITYTPKIIGPFQKKVSLLFDDSRVEIKMSGITNK